MPLIRGVDVDRPKCLCKGIDAHRGADGIPPSATDQSSLFTEKNASKELGYHLPAFSNERLIAMIKADSIFKRVRERGLQATFANAYRPLYFEQVKARTYQMSVTTQCVLAGGQPFRGIKQLRKGKALCWDMTNQEFNANVDSTVPIIDSWLAGKRLASISKDYNLVVYETFLTVLLGHSRVMEKIERCLKDLDQLVRGVIGSKGDQTSIILISDCGNIEDLSTGGHATNQVPLCVVGPIANRFDGVALIEEILDVILP